MKKLFTTIRDRVGAQVPEVKYFDWDYGQFDGESGSPVTVPAVLMDIENIDMSHAGRGLDIGNLIVVLRCGFRIKGRSDSNAPVAQSENALAFLDTLTKIGTAVDGYSTENTGSLQMMGMVRVPAPGINVYEYRFMANYYRKGNLVEYGTVSKPPADIK